MKRSKLPVSDSALRRRARVDYQMTVQNLEEGMCVNRQTPEATGERDRTSREEFRLQGMAEEIHVHACSHSTGEYSSDSIRDSAVKGDVHSVSVGSTYCNYYDMTESDESQKEMSETEETESLRHRLSNWALTYGVSHIALTALLAILCFYHPELPKDARTILRTKTNYSVKEMCSGLYHYFGIVAALQKTLYKWKSTLANGTCLRLQVNIDGLPLFKSSKMQLWPILGLLVTVPMKEPVVIGLFSGIKKPNSVTFLEDFVTELADLEKGFDFEEKRFTLTLDSVICDTPARSFVKSTKSFNGYHGCDKCTQNGVYINNRMTYPLVNCVNRTDESFSIRADEEHHQGPHPFTGVNIGMVSQFPLDYMHLVCLGVVRRLINLWLKGPLCVRLPSRLVDRISDSLLSFRAHIPDEFARKPRSLKEVDRWKATEFRQFLLYTGTVVLRDTLNPEVYSNFLLLSTAIAILVLNCRRVTTIMQAAF
ncbi:uncharacterized protein LOC143525682 isoform X1 [Brachyhypopomus gauderio]|uniref:uncharacterized protein LOC143525682 isoform X1 n=1 Tax=Brachyhypopomus gauderio TaxID=698409 RepID=UPI004042CA23